jgi:DNA-binding NtrC family response regulator
VIRKPIAAEARDLYAEAHRRLDQVLLPRVLEHTRGNQYRAALLLGFARQTVGVKLRNLGLSAPLPQEAEENDPAPGRGGGD